jgi:DNA-binding winged helix-turn-helix (wHTH) protein
MKILYERRLCQLIKNLHKNGYQVHADSHWLERTIYKLQQKDRIRPEVWYLFMTQKKGLNYGVYLSQNPFGIKGRSRIYVMKGSVIYNSWPV